MAIDKLRISLTERCSAVLHAHGITAESYGPAYDGESVGLDLYHCGEETAVPGRTKWSVFEEPVVLIPTGIKIDVPPGCVGFIKERGSITQTGLMVRGGVIDPGYTGEVFVNLINVGERDTTLPYGVKLPVQLIVVRCYNDFEVISSLEFLERTRDSNRQIGSVGSSNIEAPESVQEEEA